MASELGKEALVKLFCALWEARDVINDACESFGSHFDWAEAEIASLRSEVEELESKVEELEDEILGLTSD